MAAQNEKSNSLSTPQHEEYLDDKVNVKTIEEEEVKEAPRGVITLDNVFAKTLQNKKEIDELKEENSSLRSIIYNANEVMKEQMLKNDGREKALMAIFVDLYVHQQDNIKRHISYQWFPFFLLIFAGSYC